jgi:hypothetical protein
MCRHREKRYSSCRTRRCHLQNPPSPARAERLSPANPSCPRSRSGDRRRNRRAANPSRPHPAGGSRDLIVGNVVDLEFTSIDVAQHEIGCAGGVNWRKDVDITAQTCALMPTALSRMRFIAFAHSSAVFVSSNTSVNAGDDSACPRKNPGSSGAPCSREMLCTVLRTQAMFSSPFSPALLPPPIFCLTLHGRASMFFILSQSGERPER